MKLKKSKIFALVIAIAIVLSSVFIPKMESNAATMVVQNLHQVGAKGGKSITVAWNKVPGATGYYLIAFNPKDKTVVYANNAKISENTTKYTIKVKSYSDVVSVGVYCFDAGGNLVKESLAATVAYTAPSRPAAAQIYSWLPNSAKPDIRWTTGTKNKYYPSGYEAVIYTLGNKKIKTIRVKSLNGGIGKIDKSIKKIKNKGFKIKVRAFNVMPGSKKRLYSPYSKVKSFVPAALITSAKATSYTTGVVSWKGIPNATSYTVYKTVGMSSVKICTVTTTSAELSRSDLASGIFVTANVRVKGKLYKSTVLKQRSIRTMSYY